MVRDICYKYNTEPTPPVYEKLIQIDKKQHRILCVVRKQPDLFPLPIGDGEKDPTHTHTHRKDVSRSVALMERQIRRFREALCT